MAARMNHLSLALVPLAALVWALPGCDDKAPEPTDTHQTVKLAGKSFKLELALDDEKRFKGLSFRNDIPADGGMLFVFTDRGTRVQNFVMRDCAVPIDIIYLDPAGRITAMHAMTPEPPRGEGEKENSAPFAGAPEWAWTNARYEARLKQYSSRYAAQFVIELKGGTLEELKKADAKFKEGAKVELPIESLKKRAK